MNKASKKIAKILLLINSEEWDFSDGPVVENLLPMQGTRV